MGVVAAVVLCMLILIVVLLLRRRRLAKQSAQQPVPKQVCCMDMNGGTRLTQAAVQLQSAQQMGRHELWVESLPARSQSWCLPCWSGCSLVPADTSGCSRLFSL